MEIPPALAGMTRGGIENHRLVRHGAEHMLGLAVEIVANDFDL